MTAGSATFGDLLRRHRLALGLTQEELAERAQVSPRAISDLERGLRTRPWRDTIQFLAAALQLGATARAELELAARRPGPPFAEPPPRAAGSDVVGSRTNLPAFLTRLIGRERETVQTADLLRRADVRLVTLTGPGGIGKTSLALQIATDLVEEFAGGVVFVPLAPVGDPNLVVSTIARASGVSETSGPPLVETLKDALGGRPLLLVLDNFEHLLAAATSAADLLASCPHLKMLVTSRSLLQLRGEHEFPVPPLALPDRDQLPSAEQLIHSEAIRLFVERARAIKPDFEVTSENASAVAAICHHLDGLPLAIELAAARLRVLAPAELLHRLGDRFRILTGGARDLPIRQQTLGNTLAWSYDLLADGEKTLFQRLSVFTDGCTLDAVEAVGGDLPIDLLDGLTSLVNQSLLRRGETRGAARFSMLETIREYGRSLLAASGEESAIRERHASYFLALVDDCARLYTSAGPGSLTWDARLEPEQANLRAALAWLRDHDSSLGLRLAAGLGWFWVWHVDLAEGEEWLTTLLDQTPGELGERGRALLALAAIKNDRSDVAGAQSLFEESLAICRQVDDRWGIARSLIMLALQARSAGAYARAATLAKESLAIAREIDVVDSVVYGLTTLGQVQRLRGDFARARELIEEARRLAPGAPFPRYQLGLIAEAEGDLGQAEGRFQEALAQPPHPIWDTCLWLALLGRVTLKQGDPVRARRLFVDSLALARQNGHQSHSCRALYDLAILDWDSNVAVGRSARLAEGLHLAQQGGDRQTRAFGLLLTANHAIENGAFLRAIRLFGAADALVPGYGFDWDPFDRATFERSLVTARGALDPDVAASAWAEGHAMTPEGAIAYALEGEIHP